jgi:hypothetical protein
MAKLANKVSAQQEEPKEITSKLPGSGDLQTKIAGLAPGAAAPISGYIAVYDPVTNSGQVTLNFSDGTPPQKFSGIPDTTISCLLAMLSHTKKAFVNGFVQIQE